MNDGGTPEIIGSDFCPFIAEWHILHGNREMELVDLTTNQPTNQPATAVAGDLLLRTNQRLFASRPPAGKR